MSVAKEKVVCTFQAGSEEEEEEEEEEEGLSPSPARGAVSAPVC